MTGRIASRLARAARGIGRFFRREDGNSTIEFVIIFPVFMLVFFSTFEGGVLMLRAAMLDRAVDMTVRGLRLGAWTPPTHAELQKKICELAAIIPDCKNALILELRPVDRATWEPLGAQSVCQNRSEPINPIGAATFTGGGINEMMLVRACAVFDPLLPTYGLGSVLPTDSSGAYHLIAASAFVNEP